MKRFCAACGGVYELRKDGKMRKHKRFKGGGTYTSGQFWEPCPGSGEDPRPDDEYARAEAALDYRPRSLDEILRVLGS